MSWANEFEKRMEDGLDPDRIFKAEGFAQYRVEFGGAEYAVGLFAPGKGVISRFDSSFNQTYLGACHKGDEENYIPFSEPIVCPEDMGTDKAREQYREVKRMAGRLLVSG